MSHRGRQICSGKFPEGRRASWVIPSYMGTSGFNRTREWGPGWLLHVPEVSWDKGRWGNETFKWRAGGEVAAGGRSFRLSPTRQWLHHKMSLSSPPPHPHHLKAPLPPIKGRNGCFRDSEKISRSPSKKEEGGRFRKEKLDSKRERQTKSLNNRPQRD